MRRLVFGLGGLQVVAVRRPHRRHRRAARQRPGGLRHRRPCLALSSTAIVIEVLSDQRRLTTTAGRTSFAILLAQDLAVVPHPAARVASWAPTAGGSLLPASALALAKRRWRCAIVVVGRLLLRPLFRLVARPTHRAVRGGDAVRHRRHGLHRRRWPGCRWRSAPSSPACCSPRPSSARPSRRPIEPFKGLLLGVFFFTVGMSIDLRELAREPLLLLASRRRPDRASRRC